MKENMFSFYLSFKVYRKLSEVIDNFMK